MADIILCVMPKVEPDAPTAGPGVLKAHLLEEGFTAEVVDLNIKLFNSLQKKGLDIEYYNNNEVYFSNQPSEPLNQDFENFYQEHRDIFAEWIEMFRQKNPKWIGMSLLSAFSVSTSIKLSQLIREHLPHIKIVWGGTNVQHGGFFKLVNDGLIDAFIKGDAERGIVELLRGNWSYKGINNIDEIDEIIPYDLSLPPNYDDINWENYIHIYYNKPAYVTASRGCVRKCTFCNDWQIWPTYRYKTPKKVAEDLDLLKGKHGRNTFLFTDSLINGSISNFRGILLELKNLKQKYHPQIFRWSSHMIVRPKSQMPESDFKLLAESGCIEAVIGVESFSENVRNHMRKKYTNDDIFYWIEMLDKYKIRNQLLILVGYATETEEDHQQNLNAIDYIFEKGWGYTIDPRGGGGPLIRWTFGNSLLLNEKHALFDMVKDDPTWKWQTAMNWKYKDNDMATRLRRWKESIERVQKYIPAYRPSPTTERTIEITEERLINPNGPKFWSE
jgi:hypothetical protein